MRRIYFLGCLALCAAALAGLAAASHAHAAQTFGTTVGLPDPALAVRPASIRGVNVALEQYGDPAAVVAQLTGLPWLRQTFAWDEIEPQRGGYAWTTWDRVVGAATSGDHQLIAVLNYSPEWARPAGRPRSAPPLAVEDFAAFAGAFAERYGEAVSVYQIWDEPNLASGWGDQPPSAGDYAALLEAAYGAIHAADPSATVLAGALAPTLETGPDNLSDLLYLQQLYDQGAGSAFDGAAGKPFGFYTGPNDRQADAARLNFSRFALLREVIERNGDSAKLLWGGNFGWNTLDSPWGKATPEEQVDHTLAAFARAESEWPWAGVLALETLQPPLPPGDPHWGFALLDPNGLPTPLLAALTPAQAGPPTAAPGNYSAFYPGLRYAGDWQLGELGADIPEDYAGASVTLQFEGTDLALKVRRADYRGYLYVTIDGQPANGLPQDERGAYLVLTAPEAGAPQVTTIAVATGLAPGRTHTAVLVPERGWGQWAFVGFSVGLTLPDAGYAQIWALLAAVALASAGCGYHLGRGLAWGEAGKAARRQWERLGGLGQVALTGAAGGLLYLSAFLTWGNEATAVSRRFGDAAPIALTALTAGLLYFSPSLWLALAALAVLFGCIYLRLELGLWFTALFVPFYLQYRLLWQRGFAMVEICVLLTLAAWLLHNARPLLVRLARRGSGPPLRLSGLDWAVGAYFIVATLSTLNAGLLGVALREWRLVMLEPVVYYCLLRATPLDRRGLWRLVDFFMLGAVAVALVGVYQHMTGTGLITAEEGLARIRSVYGSPNNLALYLGRALPVAVAVLVLGRERGRRALYGLAAALLAVTLVLTFSKGALLLGAPAALAVVLIAWLGRRGWWLVGGGAAAGLAALPLLARTPRFAGLFDFSGGTSFFRVRLWVSAWRMFLDHPLLGVGPDNFLALYRSRYILPEAWQEPNLSHPHNILLDFLSRLGVPGFAAGVWLIGGFWVTALRAYRRLAAAADAEHRAMLPLAVGLMGLVADMLAHGLVDHSFFLVDLAYVFFLALAAVQHLARLAEPAASRGPEAAVLQSRGFAGTQRR
ncbi:MAG: O-antigen ligase family protein [Anaerolineales bacterium]|nr:O-antigen ligase family protein [Anaerolineales bacterium]